VHCFGPRCDCCRREPEVVRHDDGGWISGPSPKPGGHHRAVLAAVRRPVVADRGSRAGGVRGRAPAHPTAEHVLAAHTIWELAAKVPAAEQQSGDDQR
jgi:hypothetical protein